MSESRPQGKLSPAHRLLGEILDNRARIFEAVAAVVDNPGQYVISEDELISMFAREDHV